MARPDYVPDYIPDEEVENYKFYYEYEIVPQLDRIEALYNPSKKAPEPESREQARDPFSSFMATPEQKKELKRTEERRMMDTGLEEAVLARNKAELANQEVDLRTLSPEARRVFESVRKPEMTEIEGILYNTVMDPALKESVEKAQKDFKRDLNKEKGKLFDYLTLQNIQAGQDIQTAQRNAQTQIIAIERAERVPAGFVTPPVRAGERKVTAPVRGEYAPSLGEAFSRQTLVSEQDVRDREEAAKLEQRQRSQMYSMFAQQAVGQLKAEEPTYDSLTAPERTKMVGERAKQIERNYVQGELLTNYLKMARVGYMDSTGKKPEDLTPEDEKQIANLGGFLYYDFVDNVYPEYSGNEQAMRAAGIELDEKGEVKYRSPTFFEEVFTAEEPTGAVRESRTAASLRGLGGLIRPITEAITDFSTYPQVTDPLTGEVTFPEGEPYFFQTPITSTAQREAMSYTDRVLTDIRDGRFLSEDMMAQPRLVAGLGEEGAGILGLVTEIALPVTPVGVVGQGLRGGAMASKPAQVILRSTSTGARKFYTPITKVADDLASASTTAARGDSMVSRLAALPLKTAEVGTRGVATGLKVTEKVTGTGAKVAEAFTDTGAIPLVKAAEFAEAPLSKAAEFYIKSKADRMARKIQITPSMMDEAVAETGAKLQEALQAGDDAAVGLLREEIDALQRLQQEFNKGVKYQDLETARTAGYTDALGRVIKYAPEEYRAILNNIVTAQRLIDNISNEAASGAKALQEASSNTAFFNRVINATIQDMIVHGAGPSRSQALAFMNSSRRVPTPALQREIAAHLGDERNLAAVKQAVTEDYIHDFIFNTVPENYIFISPRTAIQVTAYRRHANEAMLNSRKVMDDLNAKVDADGIVINVDKEGIKQTLVSRVKSVYGGLVGRNPVVGRLLDKIESGGLVKLTQDEMDFFYGAIREFEFRKLMGAGEAISPLRATEEAVKVANVPLARRQDIFRAIKAALRPLHDSKINYTKASQYGLVKTLQEVEQAMSNLPERMRRVAQEAMKANGNNTVAATNQMIKEAADAQGIVGNIAIQRSLMQSTFNLDGISVEVFEAFINSRVLDDSIDYIQDFSQLYDDFVKLYPSKELDTLGNKLIDRKNITIHTMIFVAEGQKTQIFSNILDRTNRNFPDLFYKSPPPRPIDPVTDDPSLLKAEYADALQDLEVLKTSPLFRELEDFKKANEFDIENLADPRPVPTMSPQLRQFNRDFLDQQNVVRNIGHQINANLAKQVVAAIGYEEASKAATQMQRRMFNALLSDLFEGDAAKVNFMIGEYVATGQELINTRTAETLLSQRNIGRAKQVAALDTEVAEGYVGLITAEEKAALAKLGIEENEDVLASMLILKVASDNYFEPLNAVLGFKPQQMMQSLEASGFPPMKASMDYEALRPQLVDLTPQRAVLALPSDMQILTRLKAQNIEGSLGQTIDKLSRKSQSLGEYAVSSAGYGIVALNQSIKGGMLGGVVAPTGKYLSVNTVTAPFIMAFTTPSVMGRSFGNILKTFANVPLNLLRASTKVAGQADFASTTTIGGLGGGFVGLFAGNPAAGALIGITVTNLLKAAGNSRIGEVLARAQLTDAVITTMDGRIITKAGFEEMLERNNILYSQVNFEFGQRAYDSITRQLQINAQGKKRNPITQAFSWIRPDRPNFWNTIAQETDNAFRMQAFRDALYLGFTEEQAAQIARRSLLDYSNITKAEEKSIAQYFLFYSFMRQSFVETLGAITRRDPSGIRNIAAAVRFSQAQKEIANTDELMFDDSMKGKAMAAAWTKLGKSYDKTMTLHYGPAFPSTESFMQLANTFFYVYDGLHPDYTIEGGATNSLTELLIIKGNPVVKAILDSQRKKFRSENAPHGIVPVREMIALQSSGTFPFAQKFFELEPIPAAEMSAGRPTYLSPEDQARFDSLSEEEKETLRGVQYRIGSKTGSRNYLLFKIALLTSGFDRGTQEWAASTAEKLELKGARMKRYSDGNIYLEAAGLQTPIAVPNYIVERDRVIRQIIKEMRAEQE